jgi:hypothetical protein
VQSAGLQARPNAQCTVVIYDQVACTAAAPLFTIVWRPCSLRHHNYPCSNPGKLTKRRCMAVRQLPSYKLHLSHMHVTQPLPTYNALTHMYTHGCVSTPGAGGRQQPGRQQR